MRTLFMLAILLGIQPLTAVFAETTGPKKGTLIVMGGGGQQTEIWKRFLALSGGENAKIVIIPTANEDTGIAGDETAGSLQKLGAKQVTTLHTRDPKEADTEKFVEPLRTATGVWIGGGRQWRLADAYLNTRVVTELKALLERGGVIGGTSAGATIQGDFLVRGDTKGNELMEGDHLVGFGFIRNVAIDQHILRRNRQFDLLPVIEKHPELLGIGIDENTAIVVQGDQFEVIGASYVAITDAKQWQDPNSTSPNHAATKGKFYLLSRGERFDLKTRRVVPSEKLETAP
ncbi:MAG: cyanophycinase [Chthonomonadaceae bacterium]|nr:cyanophycinase [Chthonomonadaceae bacterium]